jgi:hypothetical protein
MKNQYRPVTDRSRSISPDKIMMKCVWRCTSKSKKYNKEESICDLITQLDKLSSINIRNQKRTNNDFVKTIQRIQKNIHNIQNRHCKNSISKISDN